MKIFGVFEAILEAKRRPVSSGGGRMGTHEVEDGGGLYIFIVATLVAGHGILLGLLVENPSVGQ